MVSRAERHCQGQESVISANSSGRAGYLLFLKIIVVDVSAPAIVTSGSGIHIVVLQVRQIVAARGKPRVLVVETGVNGAIRANGWCVVTSICVEIHSWLEPFIQTVS